MKGQKVGYTRVSALDQNPDRQLEGIQVDRIFVEKASGKDTQRTQLEELMHYICESDTLDVHIMDRLARNLNDLGNIVESMTKKVSMSNSSKKD